ISLFFILAGIIIQHLVEIRTRLKIKILTNNKLAAVYHKLSYYYALLKFSVPIMFLRALIFYLVTLSLHIQSQAQELTVYTIPSPYGINWQSPAKLLKSFIKNSTSKSPNGTS